MTSRALPWVWGATHTEATADYPCDHRAAPRSVRAIRARTVDAPRSTCFTWLCQLRRAPYSYDWVDNLGRSSPRTADPALTELRVGASVMTIFTIESFMAGELLTIRAKPGIATRLFGDLTLTYQLTDEGAATRMVAVMAMPPIGRWFGGTRRWLLAWGDLVMMRKQLMVLGELAERDARRAKASQGA